MLYANAISVDISPDKGHDLGGYPHFPRPNTGIHDPLFATCFYLYDEKTPIAIVTQDLLFYSKANVKIVRKEVERRCNIPQGNIWIGCSHTHSGPWASGKLDEESLLSGNQSQDAVYVAQLNQKLIQLICDAKAGAHPAQIGYGKTICGKEHGIGGNRRDRDGITDPSVNVIAVADLNGAVQSVYANYTLHPTFLHEDNNFVSADYPGSIRSKVKTAFPHAVFGFSQGASGNQSSRYFRVGQSFDEAARVGGILGDAVNDVVRHMDWKKECSISVYQKEIPLHLRALPGLEEAASKKEQYQKDYQRLLDRKAPYLDVQNANLRMLGAEDIFGYTKMISQNKTIDLVEKERNPEISVIALDTALLLVGMPGEIFVEYANTIKEKSGFPLVIFSELTNGCLPGYVCTPEAIEEGGYEADTSMLDPAMGDEMVETALKLALAAREGAAH